MRGEKTARVVGCRSTNRVNTSDPRLPPFAENDTVGKAIIANVDPIYLSMNRNAYTPSNAVARI